MSILSFNKINQRQYTRVLKKNKLNFARGVSNQNHCLYLQSFFKEINCDEPFHVPEDTQHHLIYWQLHSCPVSWGCRIHWLHLCRGVKPHNENPRYVTKQSDGEVPIMLGLWGIRSTPSLPLLPGPLWPGVIAPDKGPIYGLNRTNGIIMLNWIVWNKNVFDNKPYLHLNCMLMLNWIIWNRTVFWHWNCTYTKLICLI